MPSGYNQDNSVYKTQQVFVYDPSGNFIDVLRDAPLLAGFKESINSGISPIRVQLPRSIDNFDQPGITGNRGSIAQGNIVKYYLYGPGLPTTGLLRYQGYIDTVEAEITESGEESVVITIIPWSSVITDHGIGTAITFGTVGSSSTYVDPISIIQYFFTTTDTITGHPYMYPLTFDSANSASSSGITVQYPFQYQDLLSTFQTIMEMFPATNWFFRINPDNTFVINQTPANSQHTLYVGQNIGNPQYREDWSNMKNVVNYTGYTATGTQFPIVTNATSSSSITTFGERIVFINDSRVQDSNTLSTLANGALAQLNVSAVRTKLRIPDYRGGKGGYNIESVKVGDSMLIIDPQLPGGPLGTQWDIGHWDVDNWDTAFSSPHGSLIFNKILQIVALNYNFDYIDVELDNLMPNLSREVYEIRQRFQDFTMV